MSWTLDPLLIVGLTAMAIAYVVGLRRLWRSAGAGNGISRRQAAAFASAMLFLVVALVSPLDALSDELNSAHMVQHMILMTVAAPLFVLGAPTQVWLWALPERWRPTFGRWRWRLEMGRSSWYVLWQPLTMWFLYFATLWIWHVPALYEAALRNERFHDFQHLTFFVTAGLFFRVLIDPIGRLRVNRGAAILYLFATSLHATILGVLMALAPTPWYSEYVARTPAWNLNALEDQQLAGLIMWMPACMVYAVVATALFIVWMQELERRDARSSARTSGNAQN